MKISTLAACFGILAAVCGAQTSNQLQLKAISRARVEAAMGDILGLHQGDDVPGMRSSLVQQVHQEIDAYFKTEVIDRSSPPGVDLRDLLQGFQVDSEYASEPFALSRDLREGPAVVAAYMLPLGAASPQTACTIRGYRNVNGQMLLAATTGSEMDGYFLNTLSLTAPVTGEAWVLAWGKSATFNGTRIRFRLYSFDGEKFKTMWAPEDMFNATIRFEGDGFVIDHLDAKRYYASEPGPLYIRDEYVLLANGPARTRSSYPAQ